LKSGEDKGADFPSCVDRGTPHRSLLLGETDIEWDAVLAARLNLRTDDRFERPLKTPESVDARAFW
jgi:hypothetical protein